MTDLARAAASLLGACVERVTPLAGGELEQVLELALEGGERVVAKSGPAPRVEAAMLRAIAATGAPAPAVITVSDAVLVLSRSPSGGALDGAWGHLGTVLADLHATRGDRFGWHQDYAFGPLPIPNGWHDDWPTFWAERRLLAHAALLPRDVARRVEALAAGLGERLPAGPPAALVHGDLWRGNVLVAGGRVSGLVDPAAYHAHAEVDLAMLTLFDRPEPAFFAAYPPLDRGADERRPVYQLWHGLVHLLLFGDGYRSLVERLLRACRA